MIYIQSLFTPSPFALPPFDWPIVDCATLIAWDVWTIVDAKFFRALGIFLLSCIECPLVWLAFARKGRIIRGIWFFSQAYPSRFFFAAAVGFVFPVHIFERFRINLLFEFMHKFSRCEFHWPFVVDISHDVFWEYVVFGVVGELVIFQELFDFFLSKRDHLLRGAFTP